MKKFLWIIILAFSPLNGMDHNSEDGQPKAREKSYKRTRLKHATEDKFAFKEVKLRGMGVKEEDIKLLLFLDNLPNRLRKLDKDK